MKGRLRTCFDRSQQAERRLDESRGGIRGPAQLDVFYTLTEVAHLFRRAPRTIRDWVRRGRLPAIRFGSALYFRRVDIDRIIASLQPGTNS